MFDTAEINELTQAELTGEWVESDRQVLPDDLEMIPPGLILATVLGSVDASRLNGHHLVRVMKAHARLEAHFAAEKMSVMAELAYCPRGGPQAEVVRDPVEVEFASTEIGTALHLTRQAADSQLGFALQLRERLPRVWELLASGLIDVARARTIVDGTDHLSEGTARHVVERIIEAAPKLTTGQLRARIRRLSVETDPEEAKTRYQEALSERRVVSQADVEGTASLFGLKLEPHRVTAVSRRINQIARDLQHGDDPRTLDQIRADVFLDLLAGVDLNTAGRLATVDITVDLETLTGLTENPGELAGFGPVIADIARQVTAEQDNAEWRYTVTDNRGVHTGITTRRPTTALKRYVEASYRHCVFPGCRMPSGDCDLDHTVAVIDGGTTTDDNLAPLCRYHHRAKHQAPWKPRRLPNGDHQFTSPLGHTYTTSGRSP
ncbi:MAG: DUF222 domain-containing protein [Acidobacteria bacterium]|nr:DUF222 domain-containing protein [Acidobacteriota bacterium]